MNKKEKKKWLFPERIWDHFALQIITHLSDIIQLTVQSVAEGSRTSLMQQLGPFMCAQQCLEKHKEL